MAFFSETERGRRKDEERREKRKERKGKKRRGEGRRGEKRRGEVWCGSSQVRTRILLHLIPACAPSRS